VLKLIEFVQTLVKFCQNIEGGEQLRHRLSKSQFRRLSPTIIHRISKMNHEEHPNPDEQQNTFLTFDEDLVQLPTIKASGTSDVDFDHLLATPLKLHEDLKEGCGGQLWPAGMVLAKYMLRKHTHSLKDQKMSVPSRFTYRNN